MNWERLITCLSGGLMYIAVSELLPGWSHIMVGILCAIVFLVAYMPLPKRMKMWMRVAIGVVAVLIVAGAIRYAGIAGCSPVL